MKTRTRKTTRYERLLQWLAVKLDNEIIRVGDREWEKAERRCRRSPLRREDDD